MRFAEHYERLRADVVSPSDTIGHAPGLSVFLLRGMAGWMEMLSAIEPASHRGSEHPITASLEVSSECRPAIVHILANMVLSCLGGSS